MDKVTAAGVGLLTASENGGNAYSYGLPSQVCNPQSCVEPGYGQITASTAKP
jgi:hypothetical protein